MKSICVYLGSSLSSKHSRLTESIITLGHQLVTHNCRLIYGGSSQGLMGLLAQSVIDKGGKVTGVIPTCLIQQEIPPNNLNELIIVNSMQERKLRLQEQADAFLVVPGGLGTLEEVFDTWNAIKLGIFNKPLGFLNIDGYYDGLFSFIKNCSDTGFVKKTHLDIPIINANSQILLTELLKST